MRELSIDIESYSEIDIKAGTYRYAEKAEILLFAYLYDGGAVECVDLLKEGAIPAEVYKDLVNPDVIKKAFNANFERTVIGRYYDIYLPPEQWQCTMILAASAGLPLSLDEASKALGTAEKKDALGKALIKYFCVPCKPTKTNGGRTRNLPEHAPEKWAQFIEYCKQDVVTEQAICDSLSWLKIPTQEKVLWDLDQKINERGVKVDMSLVHSAIRLDKAFRERLTDEAVKITGLSNANSAAQIKQWMEDEEMTDVKSLTKDSVQNLLGTVDSERSKRVLQIRAEMSKTSVRKYTTAIKAISSDGRVRGMFQFCGANRTWRWAGRILQLHNLPKITYEDPLILDQLRNLVLDEEADTIEMCFGSIPNQLSELIRTMFVPENGNRLLVGDYKAIEAVLIAWLAGEQWRLDIFKGSGKIYEASAAAMFNVPIETIKKGEGNYALRAKGKVAELACGYQGGVGALEKMGALTMGLTKEELPAIIKAWRTASPNIVKLWYGIQRAAIDAVETGELVKYGDKGLAFKMKRGNLLFRLPSGRCLVYPQASILNYIRKVPIYEERFKPDGTPYQKLIRTDHKPSKKITFYAVNPETKQWGLSDTYGGKLVENSIQGIARDCLAEGMLAVEKAGYPIIIHVHDEIVAEMPIGKGSINEMLKIMAKPPLWGQDIPLIAEGAECTYYSK